MCVGGGRAVPDRWPGVAAAGSTSQAVWPPSPIEKGSGRERKGRDQCLVPKVKRGLLALEGASQGPRRGSPRHFQGVLYSRSGQHASSTWATPLHVKGEQWTSSFPQVDIHLLPHNMFSTKILHLGHPTEQRTSIQTHRESHECPSLREPNSKIDALVSRPGNLQQRVPGTAST